MAFMLYGWWGVAAAFVFCFVLAVIEFKLRAHRDRHVLKALAAIEKQMDKMLEENDHHD